MLPESVSTMQKNSVAPAVGCHFASSDASRPETLAPTSRSVFAAAACTSGDSSLLLRSACPEWSCPVRRGERGGKLLHLDGCARFGELLLNGRRFVLGDA